MNRYILVTWPESQELMEEEWFQEEAVLHPDLSSAYFIPEDRLTVITINKKLNGTH